MSVSEISGIPVRNLWLLMLYASDLWRYDGWDKYTLEACPDVLPDLLAEILTHQVKQRLQTQLSTQHQSQQAALNRVRGRINALQTERHQLLLRGQVACEFNTLSQNNIRNNYIRAALEHISHQVSRPSLRQGCLCLIRQFKQLGITDPCPSRMQISQERCGRHEQTDQLLLNLAHLAFNLHLPTESSGQQRLLRAERQDLPWIRRLYEKAIAGFYSVVLTPQGWQVSQGKRLFWPIQQQSAAISQLLPSMQTDIILEHSEPAQRIVIDTKFTHIIKSGWHREKTFSSPHLYQLYAYLMSQTGHGDKLADTASGLLLYPAIGQMIKETVTLQGHSIRFATVDLAADSGEIRRQLLECLL